MIPDSSQFPHHDLPVHSFFSVPRAFIAMPEKKYEPLLNGAEPMSGEEITLEDDKTLDYPPILPRNRRRDRTVRLLVGLNVALATLLFLVVGFWWRENAKVPTPPYSPAWPAVKYVNRRFKKEGIFYGTDELDPNMDKIWRNLTGPSTGHIMLPADEAKRNVPSLELWFNPGHYLYGLDMFHQLHCLDIIRRSFFPKHYFPNDSDAKVLEHKQHCFDYLRQSIMCAGDVTLDHWFNYTWTSSSYKDSEILEPSDDWMNKYTQNYRDLSPKQWASWAPLMWDTTHQCRDYDSLYEWVRERQLVDQHYLKSVADKDHRADNA